MEEDMWVHENAALTTAFTCRKTKPILELSSNSVGTSAPLPFCSFNASSCGNQSAAKTTEGDKRGNSPHPWQPRRLCRLPCQRRCTASPTEPCPQSTRTRRHHPAQHSPVKGGLRRCEGEEGGGDGLYPGIKLEIRKSRF